MVFICKDRLVDLFLNLGCLTNAVTEVVQLCTSYLTNADNVNLFNIGRMDGEGLLYAYAIRNASYSKGLGDAAAVLCDHGAFEHLDSLTVTLFDSVVNTDGVTDADDGQSLLQLLVCKSLNQVHF